MIFATNVTAILASLGVAALVVGCSGDPGPGSESADLSSKDDRFVECDAGPEESCMACASKPGCGFCTDPKEGEPSCQAGTADATSTPSCNVPLAISNEECEGPPPEAPPRCAADFVSEDTCMACASKPGCGFCAEPLEGEASCQEGTHDAPSSAGCAVPLVLSTDSCEAAPPPLD